MKPTITVIAVFLLFGSINADDIKILQAVGDFSEGAASARKAQTALVKEGASHLLPLLKAFNGSSPLARNWLRTTFETIAAAETKAGRTLPADTLIEFIKTTNESPDARRMAYEWLLKQNSELKERLIPEMLLDPSPEFRRDAVTRLLKEAEALDGDAATATFQKALTGAVHEDQVKTIAKALKEVDIEVDIAAHFGFLTEWKIIGPFDNKEMKGYAVAYDPEKQLDTAAEYDGKLDKVKWVPVTTDDQYGLVNIAEEFENHKGSLMYATATYQSNKEQDVEFRLGTPNAWKLWVNGALVFEREEYHRGTRMDQFRVPAALKAGQNTILLKVCQNEQTQSWAQQYQFQLRICDQTGSALDTSAETALRSNQNGAIR